MKSQAFFQGRERRNQKEEEKTMYPQRQDWIDVIITSMVKIPAASRSWKQEEARKKILP